MRVAGRASRTFFRLTPNIFRNYRRRLGEMEIDMSNRKGGSIGTSCGITNIGPPNLGLGTLTPWEKKALKNMKEATERRKIDPKYAAEITLKMQLASYNSTTSPRAKKMKKKISLAKFSWDKED